MGTNTINDYSGASTIANEHNTQYKNAVCGDVVPRNAVTGAPEDKAGNLGTATYEWNNVRCNSLVVGGTPFDPSNLLDAKNQIVSGAVRSGSNQPLFLQCGTANSVKILGATTDLKLVINSQAVTYSVDVTLSSLTTAPSTNNTALVNNTDLSGQDFTKYIRKIAIDNIGSEISALNGQYAAFALTNEVFIAKVNTTDNQLEVYQRGSFFDASNAPIEYEAVTDNDVVTLLKLVWVFADTSGTTGAVAYTTPIYASAAPSSPATGDYWFDVPNELWKRYDGSTWATVNRTLLGYAVLDATDCIATRCLEFSKIYNDYNNITCAKLSSTQIQTSKNYDNIISVDAKNLYINNRIIWDMATDLESGVVEAISTTYYFYITETGAPKISDIRPVFNANLRGVYHPHYSWRWVATANNDASGNLEEVTKDYVAGFELFEFGTHYFLKPEGVNKFKVTLTGDGANSSGNGDNSTFLGMTATGGSGTGSFVAATGGDINLVGSGISSYWGGGYLAGAAAVVYGAAQTASDGAAATAIKYYTKDDLDYVKIVVGGNASVTGGVCLIEYIG
jgi:hypothetical protein